MNARLTSMCRLYSLSMSTRHQTPSLCSLSLTTAQRSCNSIACDVEKPVLTLFTKEGCTLCVKALDEIQDAVDDDAYVLRSVDITAAGNETWLSRYQYEIPVFHLNGHFLMKHRADCKLLSAELAKLRR